MGTTAILYLVVALGSGLISWSFLKSTLKVQKLGGPTTMGFLFSAIFLFLTVGTTMIGFIQLISARFLFAGAIFSFTTANALSLLLVRYILSLKIPRWQVLFLAGSLGIIGTMLAVFSHTTQTIFAFIFLLHAIVLVPLFFVFHHHFLLSRDAETKQKSFWFMVLMPFWLSALSFSLLFTPSLGINPLFNNFLSMALGIFLLSFVGMPFLRLRISKPKISPASPEVISFLNSF